MTDETKVGAVEAHKQANAQAKADAAKDAEASKAKQATAASKAKKGEPKPYTSTSPTYVDGRYYPPGELFVTGAVKGDDWTEVTPKEAAAIQASTDSVPDDANLEEAHIHALQAVAIIKHVPIAGIASNKDALITAIKAAYEPAL